jgi:uncharacterized spore protein YtfJ
MAKNGKPRRVRIRELVAALNGAKLCYGKAIEIGDRAVVPVARVHAIGGGGGGVGTPETGQGGGGGGRIDAAPIGFIDIGPEGARFQPIRDPERTMRAVRSTLGAVGAVAASVAGVRALRSSRRPVLPAPRKLLERR